MKKTRLWSILTFLLLCMGWNAHGQVTLAWNPIAGPVTNYTVYWGTNSGVYVFSANAGLQTSLTITGLATGYVYYFSVTATASDGSEGPYSAEIVDTNLLSGTPETNSIPNVPPVPDLGGGGGTTGAGGSSGGSTTANNSGGNNGTSGNGSSSGGSGGNGGTPSQTSLTSNSVVTSSSEFPIAGVPPELNVTWTNDTGLTRPLLGINGTVGAYLWVQSTTNMANPDAWNTITNLPITVANTNAQTNAGAPSALTTALVPALQSYEVMDSNPPPGEFYRVVMPYDYSVLAGSVLNGAGYPARLLLVRMPGVPNDDVCYVNNQSSYIFYDAPNNAFGVQPAGSTIRQIANTLASALGQSWTTASEYSYSNGVSTILATVVETEPASSDPVAKTTSSTINIDF